MVTVREQEGQRELKENQEGMETKQELRVYKTYSVY
jgi:hypothetical protein